MSTLHTHSSCQPCNVVAVAAGFVVCTVVMVVAIGVWAMVVSVVKAVVVVFVWVVAAVVV